MQKKEESIYICVCAEGEGDGGSASYAHGGYEEGRGGGGHRDERDKPDISQKHNEGCRHKHGEKDKCANGGENISKEEGGERDKEREGEKGRRIRCRGRGGAPARHPPGVNKAPVSHCGSRVWRT